MQAQVATTCPMPSASWASGRRWARAPGADGPAAGGPGLPSAARQLRSRPRLGTRTWGGLIGIFNTAPFVDGGVMTVPHFRFSAVDNRWTVENEGVAPDIEVKLDPVATNDGRDSQLEAAIEQINTLLENYADDIPRHAPPLPEELGK